ncbi:GNAT family N-acetyltransferase [Delftia acidovorans]|uniref:GNAT family N-acetyltransferase n=1 Tax=Delftia acidovorans TaxID=80866 RepID=UPI0028A8E00A|nr:GNAT family N-acetyltransferase [Delftia acidovorans]
MSWSDTTITSQRLALRPFTAADADEAFACITPTLTRYLSFEPASTPAEFEAVWRGWLQEIAAGTDFNFTLRERTSGRFTGLLGLHRARDAEPELGIWIREDVHGQGYGREAVAALAAWAAETFAPQSFSYPVAEANTASRRIAEGLGGVVVEQQQRPKYAAVIYRIPARRPHP